jgi:hypothetical protein
MRQRVFDEVRFVSYSRLATIARVVLVSLAVACTALIVQRSYVLWRRLDEFRSRTEQMRVTVPADVRFSEIVTERLYSVVREERLAAEGVSSTLLLVNASNCEPCEQSLDTWSRTLNASSYRLRLNVWIIAYDGAIPTAGVLSVFGKITASFRVMKVADPVAFRAITGIETLPVSVLVRQDAVTCIISGRASESSIKECLASSGHRQSPAVYRDAQGVTLPLQTERN